MRMGLAGLCGALLATSLVAQAQTRLYVGDYAFNDPHIRSMNLDGSDFQDLLPVPISDWLIVGLAVDEAAGKIYWNNGNFQAGLIRRSNLDGSGLELVVPGLKIPRGLAIDTVNGKIYWTDSPPEGFARGIVQRANLDGSNVETIYSLVEQGTYGDFSFVGNPTVDPVNGYVYFASDRKIVRLNIDGPPFRIETVVTGVSTALRVQLDIANNQLYFIDTDTISDAVVRANLDNTGYTVVVDATPGVVESSGLGDLVVDLDGGKLYYADEINTMAVFRADLDGSNVETIYNTISGYNSDALAFDHEDPQPIADCNNNGVRDIDDLATSEDCNGNGIPDECEDDPCATVTYLLEQPWNGNASLGRALGGTPPNTRWTIFQPFDVPAGGWDVGTIATLGVTHNYMADGGVMRLLPDDAGSPDEDAPIASHTFAYRFASEWADVTFNLPLAEGRYWVELSGAEGWYTAQVGVGTSGLLSISRSSGGNTFLNQPPIALRIKAGAAQVPGDVDGDGHVTLADLATLLSNFGIQDGATREQGDVDGDGDIDLSDLAILLSNFGL